MKKIFLLPLLLVCISPVFSAGLAPKIDRKSENLRTRVESDLKSGALSKVDADELIRALDRAKKIEDNAERGSMITRGTRRNLREDLAKIADSLDRKERQQKAATNSGAALSSSPAATPVK